MQEVRAVAEVDAAIGGDAACRAASNASFTLEAFLSGRIRAVGSSRDTALDTSWPHKVDARQMKDGGSRRGLVAVLSRRSEIA